MLIIFDTILKDVYARETIDRSYKGDSPVSV